MRSVCFRAFLCISVPLFGTATAADPPLAVEVSRGVEVNDAKGPVRVVVPVGRFFSLVSVVTDPLTYDVSEPTLIEQYSTPAGAPYPGIRFDEPPTAKIKGYKFTTKEGKPAPAECFLAISPGTVRVTVWQNGKGPTGGPGKVAEFILELTGGLPPPKPDDPVVPPVNPSPFAADGLHVLIVFGGNEPESQKAIIYGQAVRSYLLAKCATGPDGKTKQARIWPATVDASGESKLWQDVFARPRKSVPWIVVGNGKAWEEGPLPATEAEAMTLLRKYGGN